MHWWALAGLVVAIFAFMGDLGWLEFPNKPIIPALPGGCPTIVTMLLFIVVLGILGRIFQMSRRGEKESLRQQIHRLETRIKELEQA
jgi:hypothetical protein